VSREEVKNKALARRILEVLLPTGTWTRWSRCWLQTLSTAACYLISSGAGAFSDDVYSRAIRLVV
jgi:hypothetical protein